MSALPTPALLTLESVALDEVSTGINTYANLATPPKRLHAHDKTLNKYISNTLIACDFDYCRNIGDGGVFIIASGESAKNFPIEDFAHVPMITMNGAISLFSKTDIKPYFYVCTDDNFAVEQPDLFAHALAISQRVALREKHARSISLRAEGELYFLSKAPKFSLKERLFGNNLDLITGGAPWSKRAKTLGFSKNLKKGFFDARTVVYAALQIAFHVGFTKVFLVGVDLNQNVGRFYEKADSTISPCELDHHFSSRILPAFTLMSERVMNDDFLVYNLSEPSRLPKSIVPHVTLAEITPMLHQ